MEKTHKIAQEIHELIDKINIKYKLCIYNKADQYLYTDGELYVFIQETRIKQILIGLKDLLGVNPHWESEQEHFYKLESTGVCLFGLRLKSSQPKYKAEALCARWLDGLEPMFVSEPEAVLTELKEVLEEII